MKKALLQMHTAVFLWGFTGVLGRAITLDSIWLVWYRLFITIVSLWALYFLIKKIRKISLRSALTISGIGFVLVMHWICFYASIKFANVTIALTCLSTTALLSSLLEPLILKKSFDAFEIVLGMFAVAGILIIYNTHVQFSTGIIIGLLSAILTVLASVLNKRIVDKYEPEQITLYQLSGGFLGLTILLPGLYFLFPVENLIPAPLDWLWLFILSWVCTIFTFFLYIRCLKRISAFTLNLTLTLEPVYGIVLAFIFYKENKDLSEWFYAGFGLIIFAVLFHTWRLIRPKKKAVIDISGVT
jgi:drug/metabolite transporter (DMT)-like permease